MAEPLDQIIGQALMPSVMVSAGAVILQGIWAEHRALGERIRGAANRLRDPEMDEGRRRNVGRQLLILRRRLRLSVTALTANYLAVASFLFITLAIAVQGTSVSQGPLRVLFVAGVGLMFTAVTLVLWELRLAGDSIDTELEDHQPLFE